MNLRWIIRSDYVGRVRRVGADAADTVVRPGASALSLAEAQRFAGVPLRISRVTAEVFDTMLQDVLAGKRTEIRELTDIFRGRIVDVGADEVMVEISGRESKIEAFINSMRPFGITELVRTGRIAMVRSDAKRQAETSPRKVAG